ncbi:MAG: hypothetical protein AAB316_17670, partial [Bacteroidota bacterium]
MGQTTLELAPIIEFRQSPARERSIEMPLKGIGDAGVFAVFTIFDIADWEGDDPFMNKKRQRQMGKSFKRF